MEKVKKEDKNICYYCYILQDLAGSWCFDVGANFQKSELPVL